MINHQIYRITPEQMEKLITVQDEDRRIARLSNPLLAGTYNGEVVCVMGLVPITMLSDKAYLWLITTDAVNEHKVAFGRAAHRFVLNMLRSYAQITGHCSSIQSIIWLTRLGAKFGPKIGELHPFEITKV